MKKGLLFLLVTFMMVSIAEAHHGKKTNSKSGYYNYIRTKPIQFVERGIKFYVYPNGKLDFNTNVRHKTYSHYRNGRRYAKRTPFLGVRISRDYYGRVNRIGNTFINYNRYGKVSRIGSVFIDYRYRRMTRVGGIQISYDHYGNVRYFGQVKSRHNHHDYNYEYDEFDYEDDFFYDDDFYNDYEDYDEDDNFYYYKSKKGKSKGHKKSKIIKRKKLKKKHQKRRS